MERCVKKFYACLQVSIFSAAIKSKAKILVFDITGTFLHGLNLWMESFVIRQLLSRRKKTCCYWVVSIGWVIGPFSREDVAERMSQGRWDSEIMLMETFPNIIFHEVILGLRLLILMTTQVPSQSMLAA